MKIGILTFHCAHNYGAVLQAFALQEFLKGLGHEVEFIDYRPRYALDRYYVPLWKRLLNRLPSQAKTSSGNSATPAVQKNASEPKKASNFLSRFFWGVARRRGFKNFISKKLNLSRERFSEGGVKTQRYDAIIFGSDQIWNSRITGGDTVFFGDIAVPEKTLKIAYAASAGETYKTLGGNPTFLKLLKNFNAIAVREKVLADALEQKIGREINVVLDPTLLADKSIWDKIAVPPKRERKYVLVYQMIWTPAAGRIARELAEQIDADVVLFRLIPDHRQVDKKKEDRWGRESPEQFIGLFKNAACIVSISFHGTAFSIIYKKPFYHVSIGNKIEIPSIRHILSELGLSDRIVDENAHPKFSEIDYDKARLETLRATSRGFLENALSSKARVSGNQEK